MNASFRRSLGSLLVATLLCAACVTGRPDGAPAPESTLEVINRTGATYWVETGGWVLGHVLPHSRHRIHRLTPGTHDFLLRPAPGMTGPSRTDTLTLEDGARARVAIGEVGDEGEPPPLADLVVRSELDVDVAVTADGQWQGQVLAGDVRHFRDLPSGEVRVMATGASDAMTRAETLSMTPDGVTVWTLTAPTEKVIVVNDTRESVTLTLNGERVAAVAASSEHTLPTVKTGAHVLVALGARTGRRTTRAFTLQEGFPQRWTLTGGLGKIIVHNRTGESLALLAPDGEGFALEAGQDHTVSNLAPGAHTVTGLGAVSGTTYSRRFLLESDQSTEWTIEPIRPSLLVVNGTPWEILLGARGITLNTLASGQQLVLPDLPPGIETVLATTRDGRWQEDFDVASLRAPATWTLQTGRGSVTVHNDRRAPLSIFIDAVRRGAVGANTSLTFTGIPLGEALVEWADETTGESGKAQVQVTAEAAVAVHVVRPSGTLSITNQTGEALAPVGALAQQVGEIAPRGTATFTLPSGSLRVACVGRRTGLQYEQRLEVPPSYEGAWVITPAKGWIVVENALSDAITLTVDGKEDAVIDAKGTLRIGPVEAGPHTLRAIVRHSHRIQAVDRVVPPDGEIRWRISTSPARLLVINDAAEPVQVRVRDAPFGRVEGRSRKVFTGLQPGVTPVTAVGLESHFVERTQVRLTEDATSSFYVNAPRAMAQVVNRSDEPILAGPPGAVSTTIAPGQAAAIEVPVGASLVEIRYQRSNTRRMFPIMARALHHVEMVVRALRIGLRVQNRTAGGLEILIGDRSYGVVGAGEERLVEDLEPGWRRLVARLPEGERIVHMEHRKLREGDLTDWVLSPTASPSVP